MTGGRSRFLPATALAAVDPEFTAILAWDFQRGLGGRATNLDRLRATVPQLLECARASGVLVVWSRHVAARPELMSDAEVWRLMRKQGVRHECDLAPYMQDGSDDGRFVDGFLPAHEDLVIEKSTPSIFIDTVADARLRAADVRTLVLTGVATDVGIELTARHALALGYYPVIVSDGVGSYTEAANSRSLESLAAVGFVATAAQIRERWSHGN